MATLVALGGLALGAYEYFDGQADQTAAQNKMDALNANKTPYETPSSIQEQINLLRLRAGQGLPGEARIAQGIQQQTSQGVSRARESATSAADLLGATTALQGQETQSLVDLQIASARQKAQNELAYSQGLGVMGQYEDKAYTQNISVPYQQQMNQLMGVQQSAYDQMTGGLGLAVNSGMGLLNQYSGGGNINNNPMSNYPDNYWTQTNNPMLNDPYDYDYTEPDNLNGQGNYSYFT